MEVIRHQRIGQDPYAAKGLQRSHSARHSGTGVGVLHRSDDHGDQRQPKKRALFHNSLAFLTYVSHPGGFLIASQGDCAALTMTALMYTSTGAVEPGATVPPGPFPF